MRLFGPHGAAPFIAPGWGKLVRGQDYAQGWGCGCPSPCWKCKRQSQCSTSAVQPQSRCYSGDQAVRRGPARARIKPFWWRPCASMFGTRQAETTSVACSKQNFQNRFTRGDRNENLLAMVNICRHWLAVFAVDTRTITQPKSPGLVMHGQRAGMAGRPYRRRSDGKPSLPLQDREKPWPISATTAKAEPPPLRGIPHTTLP